MPARCRRGRRQPRPSRRPRPPSTGDGPMPRKAGTHPCSNAGMKPMAQHAVRGLQDGELQPGRHEVLLDVALLVRAATRSVVMAWSTQLNTKCFTPAAAAASTAARPVSRSAGLKGRTDVVDLSHAVHGPGQHLRVVKVPQTTTSSTPAAGACRLPLVGPDASAQVHAGLQEFWDQGAGPGCVSRRSRRSQTHLTHLRRTSRGRWLRRDPEGTRG